MDHGRASHTTSVSRATAIYLVPPLTLLGSTASSAACVLLLVTLAIFARRTSSKLHLISVIGTLGAGLGAVSTLLALISTVWQRGHCYQGIGVAEYALIATSTAARHFLVLLKLRYASAPVLKHRPQKLLSIIFAVTITAQVSFLGWSIGTRTAVMNGELACDVIMIDLKSLALTIAAGLGWMNHWLACLGTASLSHVASKMMTHEDFKQPPVAGVRLSYRSSLSAASSLSTRSSSPVTSPTPKLVPPTSGSSAALLHSRLRTSVLTLTSAFALSILLWAPTLFYGFELGLNLSLLHLDLGLSWLFMMLTPRLSCERAVPSQLEVSESPAFQSTHAFILHSRSLAEIYPPQRLYRQGALSSHSLTPSYHFQSRFPASVNERRETSSAVSRLSSFARSRGWEGGRGNLLSIGDFPANPPNSPTTGPT